MTIAYLGLGSNIGERQEYLNKAIILLDNNEQIIVQKVSSFYDTEPVGYAEQDNFLNAVVEIKTTLEPLELIRVCQQIEAELGRVRTIRWGPRTIDIDILLYGKQEINEEDLIIPHPRMYERDFVMKPLKELMNINNE